MLALEYIDNAFALIIHWTNTYILHYRRYIPFGYTS